MHDDPDHSRPQHASSPGIPGQPGPATAAADAMAWPDDRTLAQGRARAADRCPAGDPGRCACRHVQRDRRRSSTPSSAMSPAARQPLLAVSRRARPSAVDGVAGRARRHARPAGRDRKGAARWSSAPTGRATGWKKASGTSPSRPRAILSSPTSSSLRSSASISGTTGSAMAAASSTARSPHCPANHWSSASATRCSASRPSTRSRTISRWIGS